MVPAGWCTLSDFGTISSQLTDLTNDEGFLASIRDCRRLGKYSQSSSRPRPILVILNSTIAVLSVLSLCSRLTSPISIRPDLTPADCLSHGLLLRERRSLLDAGTEKNAIRIRSSGLYVSGRLVGKVVNGVYIANQSLGDVVPHPVQLTTPIDHESSFDSPTLTPNIGHGSSSGSPSPPINHETSSDSSTSLPS